MTEEKAEKISISLPPSLLEVVDANHSNRSAYFQKLASDDLQKRGMLPVGKRATIHAKIEDLIISEGEEAAEQAIDSLFASKLFPQ